jgi:hypothetical protein
LKEPGIKRLNHKGHEGITTEDTKKNESWFYNIAESLVEERGL